MELGNKLSSAKIMNGLIKLVSLLAVELVLVGGLALYMSVTNNVAPASRPASMASVGALTAIIFNILFDIARDELIANNERRIIFLENDVHRIDEELTVLKSKLPIEGNVNGLNKQTKSSYQSHSHITK